MKLKLHGVGLILLLALLKKNNRLPETYIPKSWGPTSSFDLIKRHGFEWCEPHY